MADVGQSRFVFGLAAEFDATRPKTFHCQTFWDRNLLTSWRRMRDQAGSNIATTDRSSLDFMAPHSTNSDAVRNVNTAVPQNSDFRGRIGQHEHEDPACRSNRLGWPVHRRIKNSPLTRAVFFFHLFYGQNSSAKVSQLGEFALDRLQTFMSLTVGNLSGGFVSPLTAILPIQLLKVSDLGAETRNLFPKDCYMIHATRITQLERFERRWTNRVCI
jgi:hypothetical protein